MQAMNINWDKAREIMAGFAGRRPPIPRIADRFETEQVFELNVQQAKNDAARKIIKKLNDEACEEGRYEDRFFNFERIDKDGEKQQYYEQQAQATCDEWLSLTRIEANKTNRQISKLYEIIDIGTEKWGRKYQRRLNFPIPERPVADVPIV